MPACVSAYSASCLERPRAGGHRPSASRSPLFQSTTLYYTLVYCTLVYIVSLLPYLSRPSLSISAGPTARPREQRLFCVCRLSGRAEISAARHSGDGDVRCMCVCVCVYVFICVCVCVCDCFYVLLPPALVCTERPGTAGIAGIATSPTGIAPEAGSRILGHPRPSPRPRQRCPFRQRQPRR